MTPGGEEYVMCDYCKCRYNTKLGIYKEGCGIENVIMSWGHDEYLYHVSFEGTCSQEFTSYVKVLVNHMAKMGTSIPEGGLWAIRCNR